MTNHALDILTPGSGNSPLKLKSRYENFIGGKWVPPVEGEYNYTDYGLSAGVRSRVDKLLPRLSGTCRIRWL